MASFLLNLTLLVYCLGFQPSISEMCSLTMRWKPCLAVMPVEHEQAHFSQMEANLRPALSKKSLFIPTHPCQIFSFLFLSLRKPVNSKWTTHLWIPFILQGMVFSTSYNYQCTSKLAVYFQYWFAVFAVVTNDQNVYTGLFLALVTHACWFAAPPPFHISFSFHNLVRRGRSPHGLWYSSGRQE